MEVCSLEKVYDGEDAIVDIVFLHGLRGNIRETWTKDEVLWPVDLLSKDIEQSRIFLFGYDSGITYRDQTQVQDTEIHSDADDLCARLGAARSKSKTENRPIIFVAHSLGGLVAAQILVHGEYGEKTSTACAIAKSLRGMVFLGTPFLGYREAKPADAIKRVMKFFNVDTQEHTMKLLGRDSERLDELIRAFSDILNKRRVSKSPADQIHAFFHYETKKTGWPTKSQVVEPESAQIPGCGDASPINTDHINICKYTTDKDHGYTLVLADIAKALRYLAQERIAEKMVTKTINVSGEGSITNLAMESISIARQEFHFTRGK